MPNEADRKRPVQVRFFVNEAGLEMIKKRMSEFGTDSLSACHRLTRANMVLTGGNTPMLRQVP